MTDSGQKSILEDGTNLRKFQFILRRLNSYAKEAIETYQSIRLPSEWSWSKAPSITELYAKYREYT